MPWLHLSLFQVDSWIAQAFILVVDVSFHQVVAELTMTCNSYQEISTSTLSVPRLFSQSTTRALVRCLWFDCWFLLFQHLLPFEDSVKAARGHRPCPNFCMMLRWNLLLYLSQGRLQRLNLSWVNLRTFYCPSAYHWSWNCVLSQFSQLFQLSQHYFTFQFHWFNLLNSGIWMGWLDLLRYRILTSILAD